MSKNKLFAMIVAALMAVTMYSLTPGAKTLAVEIPRIVTIQTK